MAGKRSFQCLENKKGEGSAFFQGLEKLEKETAKQ